MSAIKSEYDCVCICMCVTNVCGVVDGRFYHNLEVVSLNKYILEDHMCPSFILGPQPFCQKQQPNP